MRTAALSIVAGIGATALAVGAERVTAARHGVPESERDGHGAGRGRARGGAAAGACTPSTGPDVIVGALNGIMKWGTVGSTTAYSIGTTSCNIGDQPASWVAASNAHPVIGQNLYRLAGGRFEQVGMSWVKHSFAALPEDLCCTCQNPGTNQLLGVGCSDPYVAFLNGDQTGVVGGCGSTCGGLGPRSEVDATTGFFLFPYGSAGQGGDAIYKRLQVANADLDPALNPGAIYYGEGQYVTADDAAAGNLHNNASYRRATVGAFDQGGWLLALTGATTRETPAVYAWQVNDPLVVIVPFDDESGGRLHLGYRATNNGDGTWHYEYALHNLDSHRAAGSFSVPLPAGVTLTHVGFHDVAYHSGEPYDGSDWAVTVGAGAVTWSTGAFDPVDDTANALRWGTLYNFRFDADTPPVAAAATIGLYRPGPQDQVTVAALGPSPPPCPWDLDGDGLAGVTDLLALIAAWGDDPGGPPDFDGDGDVDAADLIELLGNWGPCPGAGPCGDPAAGSCFEADGTPGCDLLECCLSVCAVEPVCCETAWDLTCKDLANVLCGNCGSPDAGDCCQADGTPGCDDAACCRAVCEADPFCCAFGWDELCAASAAKLCSCP